jgi:hypothetical protein
MFGSHVLSRPSLREGPSEERKESDMTFALVLGLILVVSTAYLVREWYTGELQEPSV